MWLSLSLSLGSPRIIKAISLTFLRIIKATRSRIQDSLAVSGEFLFFYTLWAGYLCWQWKRIKTIHNEINELKKQLKPTPATPEGALPAEATPSPIKAKIQQHTELMEQKSQPKWEAKVSTRLRVASADQIWPLFKDFFNLHKWFPSLSTCYGIHGTNGEPGCIRYCGGSSIPSNSSDNPVSWSTERLIAIDPIERSFSYEIVECTIGFKSYVSTVKIIPGGDDDQDGCVIEWSFTVDPVEGWRLEDLVRRYEVGLQGMANKMEEDLGLGG